MSALNKTVPSMLARLASEGYSGETRVIIFAA
jgi:hypothetical protein